MIIIRAINNQEKTEAWENMLARHIFFSRDSFEQSILYI